MMQGNGVQYSTVDGHGPAQVGAGGTDVDASPEALVAAASRCRETIHILRSELTGQLAVAFGERLEALDGAYSLVASLPPVYPEWLGSSEFLETHGFGFRT